MRVLPSLLCLAAFCTAPVHAADADRNVAHEADVAAIRAVVQQFQSALAAHDGKTLDTLFLPEHDSWVTVAGDPAARKVTASSRQSFLQFVQTNPKAIEERFANVRIDTNGAVGAVYFDFDFLVDGKVGNRGSESWQMVHADDGWKISSMLYSMGR